MYQCRLSFLGSALGISWVLLMITGCAEKQIKKEEVQKLSQPVSVSSPRALDPALSQKDTIELKVEKKEPIVGKLTGYCMVMNPPGISEKLYTPCTQTALMLIYRSGNKPIIHLIRTEQNGKFTIDIPPTARDWQIRATKKKWEAAVEIFDKEDASHEVTVILKPGKDSQLRKSLGS